MGKKLRKIKCDPFSSILTNRLVRWRVGSDGGLAGGLVRVQGFFIISIFCYFKKNGKKKTKRKKRKVCISFNAKRQDGRKTNKPKPKKITTAQNLSWSINIHMVLDARQRGEDKLNKGSIFVISYTLRKLGELSQQRRLGIMKLRDSVRNMGRLSIRLWRISGPETKALRWRRCKMERESESGSLRSSKERGMNVERNKDGRWWSVVVALSYEDWWHLRIFFEMRAAHR